MSDAEHLAELEAWAGKVDDHVRRIGRLLAADVVVHTRRAGREAFIHHAAADTLDDQAVADLKARLEVSAAALAEAVARQVHDHDWLDDPGLEPGADPGALPRLVEIQSNLDAQVAGALRALGLLKGAEPAVQPWSLPRRFIEGDDLVTLTRGLVKAVGHHRRLRSVLQHQARRQTTGERARRWDEA